MDEVLSLLRHSSKLNLDPLINHKLKEGMNSYSFAIGYSNNESIVDSAKRQAII